MARPSIWVENWCYRVLSRGQNAVQIKGRWIEETTEKTMWAMTWHRQKFPSVRGQNSFVCLSVQFHIQKEALQAKIIEKLACLLNSYQLHEVVSFPICPSLYLYPPLRPPTTTSFVHFAFTSIHRQVSLRPTSQLPFYLKFALGV